jgi:Universal stress protein family
MEEDAKSWIDNFNQQAKENNVQLRTELINSPRPVHYIILKYVEEKQIDLNVMGTRGRTGFKKLLLASTTSLVVTCAHCVYRYGCKITITLVLLTFILLLFVNYVFKLILCIVILYGNSYTFGVSLDTAFSRE